MKLLLPFFLLLSSFGMSQETEHRGTIKVDRSSCTKVEEQDSVYVSVDHMPEFNGGVDSLNQWMNRNLNYPKTALEDARSGTVFGSFVVMSDGHIDAIKILKGVNADFEKEALRLLRLMPAWKAGSCNGNYVPVKVNFPIKFILK